jgi:ribosomal protein L12E/L44/L45/RPP1/RPP2
MMPKGTLIDGTTCKGLQQAMALTGELTMEANTLPTEKVATTAVAKAVSLDESLVKATVKEVSARRLSHGERRLNSHASGKVKFTISYTIYVPEGEDHTDIMDKITEIEKGGDAQEAFTKHMTENGVTVEVATIKASTPKVEEVMIEVVDGKMTEEPAALVIATSGGGGTAPASEEEGGNVGAIVGGIIGGLVGVAVVGGLLYYFLVMKKKSES